MNDEEKALRAKLAESRAATATKQAEAEQKVDLERLKHDVMDEPHIAAAIEEHGAVGVGIQVLRTPIGCIIIKRPKKALWRRFSDADKVTGQQTLGLVTGCLVYPSPQRFEEITAEFPAALEQAGGMACLLAAASDKDATGK